MGLNKMKFKTFTWPNNPPTFTQDFSKNIAQHKYPRFDGARFQDLGSEPLTMSGSGEFFGKYAYDNFKKLQALFASKTAGKLYHPKWGTKTVRFTRLSSDEEPIPNYVSYSFEFVEEKTITVITAIPKPKPKPKPSGSKKPASSTAAGTRKHTVRKGERLWDLSKKYYGTGTKWKKIANANKKLIKNPNKLKIGWKLIIPK